MDYLMATALMLPFLGKWRKLATALAFAVAIGLSLQTNYFIAAFFFGLSLVVLWLSDWSDAKYPLFFLAMFDLIGLLRSSTFLELFIYFELAMYASYFLIFEKKSARAVVRYFIVNAIGSAFMLLSIAAAYFQSGSLIIMPQGPLMFFVLGLFIKLGIAPFQDWLVEIYKTVSLPSIIFFSAILTEISPLALLMVVTVPSPTLQIFAMVSMFIANFMALTETSLLRLIALFDASNLAYDLLAIAVASPTSRTAALYMMFSHVIAITLVFIVIVISKSKTIKDLKAPRGLEIPFYASFLVLSGLPPFHLFPSKLFLFSSVFSESLPISYFLLANLVLGAIASLRLFASVKGTRRVKIPSKIKIIIFALLATSIILGLYPLAFFNAVESQLALFIR